MQPTKQINKIHLLAGLSEQEKSALLEDAKLRELPRKAILFAHGEPVQHFYMILEGTIHLYRTTPDGNHKTTNILRAGQTLCEAEILDACKNHRVNAIALENTTLLEFTVQWLKSNAKNHSNFALNLLSSISHQLHLAEIEAEQQATMSAMQLIACFLRRTCVLYGFDPKGFDLPYSKTLIASRLGIKLETFSRKIKELRDFGINVTGSRVSITDLKSVQKHVCSFCSVSEECAIHPAAQRR